MSSIGLLLKIADGGTSPHEAVTQEVGCGLKRAISHFSGFCPSASRGRPLRRSIDLANPHRGGASGCGGRGTPYRKRCRPAPPLEKKKNSREDGEGGVGLPRPSDRSTRATYLGALSLPSRGLSIAESAVERVAVAEALAVPAKGTGEANSLLANRVVLQGSESRV